MSSLSCLILKRTKYISTLKYCRSYYSSTTILTKLVLKCIKRHFTREFENSISLRGALRAPPRRLRWHWGTRTKCAHPPSTVVCTGAPGTARNRVKGVSRAAENSAFTELTVKFLELNHTNLHNCLKGLPSLHTYENDQDQAVRKSEHVHLAHVPRCQRRRRWGARSAPWREIEFSNSRVKYHSIHLSTIFMLGLISLRFYLF